MTIDIVLAAIFLALVFLGWRSGLLRQVIRIIGLAAVVLAGPLVAELLREVWLNQTIVAAPMTEAGLLFMSGLLIYFGISVAGWLAVKVMRAASDTLGNMDRAGGATVGGIKAAAVIYLLVFVGLFLQKPLEAVDPDDRMHMRDGQATEFVQGHNVLAPWHLPQLETMHDVIVVGALVREHNLEKNLHNDGLAADLLREEDIVALTTDSELAEAALHDQYHITLADERVRDLINDQALWKRVEVVDWMAIRTEIAGEVGEPATADLEPPINYSAVLDGLISSL